MHNAKVKRIMPVTSVYLDTSILLIIQIFKVAAINVLKVALDVLMVVNQVALYALNHTMTQLIIQTSQVNARNVMILALLVQKIPKENALHALLDSLMILIVHMN